VQSPANWHTSTAKKYERAIQGLSQDICTFTVYLQQLQDELLGYTEEQQKMHLLVKMRLELRCGVTALETFPTTMDELVDAASCIEENVRVEQKEVEAKKQLRTGKGTLQASNSS